MAFLFNHGISSRLSITKYKKNKNSQSTSGDAERAVRDAIDAGYRHIDTAFLYGNEVEVGNAIRAKIDEGVIKREDIFVTTKVRSNEENILYIY